MKGRIRNRFLIGFLIIAVMLSITVFISHGAVPMTINFQGYLTTPAGSPVDGTLAMTFKIYNVLTGGTALWQEAQNVTVTKGMYNAVLGSSTPLTRTLFDNQHIYLGVTIGADPEMTPRQEITSAGYSIRADIANTAIIANSLTCSGCVTDSHITGPISSSKINTFLLDADTVDGQHASAFASSTHNHDSAYINGTGDTMTGTLTLPLNGLIAGTNQLVLSGSKVGVGISSPNSTLHIAGGNWDVGTTEGDFKIGDSTNRFKIGVATSGGGAGIVRLRSQGTSPQIRLGVGSNDDMILSSGYVGIGKDPGTKLDVAGAIRTDNQLISTIANGTSPLSVTSTTAVANLNADMLDGQHSSAFAASTHAHDTSYVNVTGDALTGAVSIIPSTAGDAFSATTNSSGDAINGYATGTSGRAGYFYVGSGNSSDSIYAMTYGAGRAGYFAISNSASSTYALHATTNGSQGAGIGGFATGTAATSYGGIFSSTGLTGFGVHATVSGANGTGVYGLHSSTSGAEPGVIGKTNSTAADASGVVGEVTSTAPGSTSAGVRGVNNGASYSGYGVYGSHAYGGTGVYGYATDGIGTYGMTDTYIGAYGYAADTGTSTYNYGGYFQAKGGYGRGVYAYANGANSRGIYAYAPSTGYAGYFSGPVYVSGNFSVGGTKNFIQPHLSDPTKEIVYVAAEGPEAMVFYRGSSQLKNGTAVVDLPDYFSMVASENGLQVQVTPTEDCNGIFVSNKSRDRFEVRELMSGKHNARFDFLITGVRAGFEKHQPVVANKHFKPDTADTVSEFEQRFNGDDLNIEALRNMLISNGILRKDGKLNRETLKKLGWKIKESDMAEHRPDRARQ